MVKVAVWGSLRTATGGAAELEVEAATLRELLERLSADHPALRPQMKRGVTVSIDGRLYNDDWFKRIEPDSEVVLLPRITGG